MTDDEMEAAMRAHIEAFEAAPKTDWRKRHNPNCLSHWFPIIRDAGMPVPKTEIVVTDCRLMECCDGIKPEGYDDFIEKLRDAIGRIGLPCFLRTGQTSHKHHWKETCCLTDIDTLPQHVYELVEFSAMCDMTGLPDDVWVVRKMLKTEPAFVAFLGDMPIVRERRYFVNGGKVLCSHPYWPPEAFDEYPPQCSDWRERLSNLNTETADETGALIHLSEKAGAAIGGYWSIDWLSTADRGWVLTDMAEGYRSFHWEGCEIRPDNR